MHEVMSAQAPAARERILETASELFYAEGLRAVGVDTIIAKAGVAKASFYKHFPSKDDLIVAFLRRRDGLWRQWLQERVEQLSPAPQGRPLAVFDALAERFARADYRGCAFINSMVELADPTHTAHRTAQEHKREVIRYLNGLLAEAGISKPDDLSYQFMMLIDGAVVTRLREGTPAAALSAKRVAATLLQNTPPTKKRSRHVPNANRRSVAR